MFYGIRALTQVLFKFRYPNDYTWPRTKIPSLLVPYGHQCDFYFSGHSGFMVLMICEFQRIKDRITQELQGQSDAVGGNQQLAVENQEAKKTLKILAILHVFLLLSLGFVILVLIVLRAHYSIGN